MKRFSRVLAMILCLTLLLTACGGTETSSSAASGSTATSGDSSAAAATTGVAVKKDPDQFTAAFETEPGKLDPQNNSSLVGIMIEKQIFDPLVDKDPTTGEIIPALATEWEWLDDTHLKMTLREGVKFHNGEDFTSDDVLFSLYRMQTEATAASFFTSLDLDNTTANGDYEVTIAFLHPFAPIMNFLTSGRAYIVPHDYMEENGNDSLNQSPVGTGPYKFVEWLVSSHVDLVRNDDYWGGAPAIKNARIRFITEPTARAIALETGEIDLACVLEDSDIAAILDGEKPHLVGHMIDGVVVNHFDFNLNFEPFNDIRVRQAIAYAVDWEAAVESAGGTIYALADSCIAPKVQYYKPTGTYEYDPERAKELLAEAGYADGFEISCIQEEVNSTVRVLETIQAFLAEVGITMTIEVADTATWIDANSKGTHDVTMGNMNATTGDPAHTLTGMVAKGTSVTSKITDERFNELAELAEQAMDETERAEIYAELQQHVYDNVLQIPVFTKKMTYGLWDYVEGFVPDAAQQISIKDYSYILE